MKNANSYVQFLSNFGIGWILFWVSGNYLAQNHPITLATGCLWHPVARVRFLLPAVAKNNLNLFKPFPTFTVTAKIFLS